MLFNSFPFLLLFLPLCLLAFQVAARGGPRLQVWLLTAASLAFYCGWDSSYLPLLLASVGFNFVVGRTLSASAPSGRRRALLVLGIAANLALLVQYKYADFLVAAVTGGSGPAASAQVLPLGISFYTFTQVAFLVDAYRRRTDEPSLVQYAGFVTFFPHLIAGPILHHHEIIPQFRRLTGLRPEWMAPGIAMFSLGLAKKVLLADTFGAVARPAFAAYAERAPDLTAADAWSGALAYTFQLYFDFSAYSDMAVGLGLMFGIWLPLNFNSPYRAESIIDFWRRWHMTLSRYLRDYVYIPLGGNRQGAARRYLNLMLTMCIGGLWHGAGWTFLCWGALHGAYLLVNHAWRGVRGARDPGNAERWLGRVATFLAVMVAWVFFRSTSVSAAVDMLGSMVSSGWELSPRLESGLRAALVPRALADAGFLIRAEEAVALLLALGLAIVWLAPNTQQLVFRDGRAWRGPLEDAEPPGAWRARPALAACAALAFALAVAGLIAAPAGEFLYFTF